jgi:DNA helicase-2/ATP-dependent DNA helicase PcrA
VGDDAQSIYSFRAATVRNILDFPTEFPGTNVVKLEQNYRSTQPILTATNHIIAQARHRFTKDLWTDRTEGDRPQLVVCQDENEQAEFVVREILQQRENGTDLRKQAVLYRASHHSVLLEGELTRRNIPYVKYGGLKFLEAAHVKDLMAFLRLAENPRDVVAGMRVLQLLPGIGPKRARQLMDLVIQAGGKLNAWLDVPVCEAAQNVWPRLLDLLRQLTGRTGTLARRDADDGHECPSYGQPALELASQVNAVRCFYEPILEEKYDNATPRKRDLEQIEQLATRFADRQTMLTQMALDPPDATEDLAGPPLRDEDYLILSTIHSAKGLEWDTVFVIHAADGNIPSDMATGSDEEVEEELRLFYVALTRARTRLYVCHPLRYYHAARGSFTDRHGYAQLTRFIPPQLQPHFHRCTAANGRSSIPSQAPGDGAVPPPTRRIRGQIQALWS